MKALVWAPQQGNWKQPPTVVHFDFSYLDTALSTTEQAEPIKATDRHEAGSQVINKSWRVDGVGRVIIEFSHELLQTLQSLLVQLDLVKAAASHSGTQLRFVIQGLKSDVYVDIAVRDVRNNSQRCHIAVSVEVPGCGGWPHLSDSQVILEQGDVGQEKQFTDAFGRVLFLGIAKADLTHLVFQIKPVDCAQDSAGAEGTL